MSFNQDLMRHAAGSWNTMLAHPFLERTADGSIPFDVFANWLRQDYLFVGGAIPFIGVLVSRAPLRLVAGLAAAIPALDSELSLFRRMAEERNVLLTEEITPTCHSYLQYLIATAHSASFEEGFTLLYCAEKAYFDCWSRVRRNLSVASPWEAFIDRWSNDAFAQWVTWLEQELDELAESASSSLREKMKEAFLTTTRYELLFWNMALQGESWPGTASA
jgi:formylaminopyrimidine deformylase / aminopyrimidine aminohydrolase